MAAKPIIERELLKLASPYGATRVQIQGFYATSSLTIRVGFLDDGIENFNVTLCIENGKAFVTKVISDRSWLDVILRKHVLPYALPIEPEYVEKLKLLW